MAEGIVVESDSGIARIRIDRPEKKNAITTGMYAAMADALEWIEEDEAVHVVVIGGGSDFTAGNDLKDFMAASMAGGDSFGELPVIRFLGRLRDFAKPVVASVRGNAVGIGTTLLLHCDVVIASTTARFRLPFAQLGLVPEAGSSLLLPLTVGRARASWLLMAGEVFEAQDAYAMGLVTRITDDAQTDTVAEEAAAKLAALPPMALRETKRLLRLPFAAQVSQQMEEETTVFSQRLASDEFRSAAMKLMMR